MARNPYNRKISQFDPEHSYIGNVTNLPRHVSTFQSTLKGFGKKNLPLMNLRAFKESVERFSATG